MPERRLVIVENPASSRHAAVTPALAYLQESVVSSLRLQTSPEPLRTRDAIAGAVCDGDVIVLAAGDDGQADSFNGIIQASRDDLAVVSLPAGGENDTSFALHGARSIEELAVIAAMACRHSQNIPVRDARPFHIEADGIDLGYGMVSGALGAVALAGEWLEHSGAKDELNVSGRTMRAKLALATRYYFEHGRRHRMPPVRHDDGRERRLGGTILIMNDGRMAGTWRNILAQRAIYGEYFSIGHYQGMWQFPRSVWFGVQSLSGIMHGRLRRHEKIDFEDASVPLLVDGERRGDVRRVVVTKGPTAPRVPIIDVNKLVDQELAA